MKKTTTTRYSLLLYERDLNTHENSINLLFDLRRELMTRLCTTHAKKTLMRTRLLFSSVLGK